ncbi:MAG: GGDEF domain-containing protein [bacterium]|nr:GGDEF domain-containing protein [bacterium]
MSHLPGISSPPHAGLFRLEALPYQVAQELAAWPGTPLPAEGHPAGVWTNLGLTGWLDEPTDPMAGTWLCAAALEHFRVEAAWLLVPGGDGWNIRGRARSRGLQEVAGDGSNCPIVPLQVRGRQVGALALWPLAAVPDLSAIETRAFLNVLAMALASRQTIEEQRLLMATDPLTELANRRHLESALERQMALARRNHRPLSVAMFDLDHFKSINDRYGHDDGDNVLKLFARTLTNHVRASDLPARHGGEEFVLVLPDTDMQQGLAVAEKIRKAVEQLVIPVLGENALGDRPDGDATLRVTVSGGVTHLDPSDSVADLLERADHALYRAKQAGRNRCMSLSRAALGKSPDA